VNDATAIPVPTKTSVIVIWSNIYGSYTFQFPTIPGLKAGPTIHYSSVHAEDPCYILTAFGNIKTDSCVGTGVDGSSSTL
jgi:hypothetical protein